MSKAPRDRWRRASWSEPPSGRRRSSRARRSPRGNMVAGQVRELPPQTLSWLASLGAPTEAGRWLTLDGAARRL